MNITLDQFEKMWNKRCFEVFGVSSSDLPDILCISDYWWEGITRQEATQQLSIMEEEMRGEI